MKGGAANIYNIFRRKEEKMIRENVFPVLDLIKPKNILVSVNSKDSLEVVILGILEVNPKANFHSTGGTGVKIREILGERFALNYCSVEDFTKSPEMEGGLVKTLHPKIHAGLLGERNNPEHEKYIYEVMNEMTGSPGVYFDVFIGNLYPFLETIASKEATSETARVNIDIGGPAMTMAAAKNWHSVAVLTSPNQYADFVESIIKNNGTTLKKRFGLAQKALKLIGEYRSSIGYHFNNLNYEKDILPFIKIKGGD